MTISVERPAVSEAVLVSRVLRHLSKLGRVVRWGVELNGHGSAHIDVCAYIGGEVIGIEAKLYDWRRAIGQAALNRYTVDRSYIAVEPRRATAEVAELAARYGVGVLCVGEDSLVVYQEAKLLSPDPRLRDRTFGRLKTGRRA